jgi:hypothetical protein
VGWKGTLRSVGAAVRAAERDAKRRQRVLIAQEKHYARLEAAERAAYEVEVFENSIELLRSVHRECGDEINWNENQQAPAPKPPIRADKAEKVAQLKVDNYRPSFFDKLFKRVEKKRAELSLRLTQAVAQDDEDFKRARKEYEAKLSDWTQLVELSRRILAGELAAQLDAIKQLDPFSEIKTLGSEISFVAGEGAPLHAHLKVHGKGVIPKEIKSLLQSGKLSTKTMPAGRFNELHQDYVCACAIRVAREVFAVLPIQSVIVTANDELLNAKTGHLEEQPILSVFFVRKTLNSLNMEELDPSESMRNFVHAMGFRKTVGLAPVVALNPNDFVGNQGS